VKITRRRLVKWGIAAVGVPVVAVGLYLSVFFFPYPLFPHHLEHAGFSVYSDDRFPEDFTTVLEDARLRTKAMELYRGDPPPRIFYCQSQPLFVFFIKAAGKPHVGQGLLISVAGNTFLSATIIDAVGDRNPRRPAHTRMQGSVAAAIAHEVAHHLVFTEVGFKKARRISAWKAEGYADYSANLAVMLADPLYDLRARVALMLDDDVWKSPTGWVDRRHFRWQLMVEYLCSVRGLGFADLMEKKVTKTGAYDELMAWYSTSTVDTRLELRLTRRMMGCSPGADERSDPTDQADQDADRAEQQGDQEGADVEALHGRPQPGQIGHFAHRVEEIVEDGEEDEAQSRQGEEQQKTLRPAPAADRRQDQADESPIEKRDARRVVTDSDKQGAGECHTPDRDENGSDTESVHPSAPLGTDNVGSNGTGFNPRRAPGNS